VAVELQPNLCAAYDGRLRLFWPDDLYLVGSAEALVGLRRAIDRALTRGIAACTGVHSDERGRLAIVLVIPPDPALVADELRDKPAEVPGSEPAHLLTLFDRRLSEDTE
jgi:hypothetical protein